MDRLIPCWKLKAVLCCWHRPCSPPTWWSPGRSGWPSTGWSRRWSACWWATPTRRRWWSPRPTCRRCWRPLICWTWWRCGRPAAGSWSDRWMRWTAWASTASPRHTRAESWSDAAWSTSSSTSAVFANRWTQAQGRQTLEQLLKSCSVTTD